jgi:hypothetical protein
MSGAEPCLCHVNLPKLHSYCHLSLFFFVVGDVSIVMQVQYSLWLLSTFIPWLVLRGSCISTMIHAEEEVLIQGCEPCLWEGREV